MLKKRKQQIAKKKFSVLLMLLTTWFCCSRIFRAPYKYFIAIFTTPGWNFEVILIILLESGAPRKTSKLSNCQKSPSRFRPNLKTEPNQTKKKTTNQTNPKTFWWSINFSLILLIIHFMWILLGMLTKNSEFSFWGFAHSFHSNLRSIINSKIFDCECMKFSIICHWNHFTGM